jgi:Glycosyl hydrolases family 28
MRVPALKTFRRFCCVCVLIMRSAVSSAAEPQSRPAIFNIKDFGASGRKADNAQEPIQKAIEACASAGGGTVLFPAGEYSSGTLHLRSHVRLDIQSGATLYSIKDKKAFDKDALIYADGVVDITVEGRGTIDGQAAYEWRLNDLEDDFIRPNLEQMEALGKPLLRSFPKKDQFGKLFLLLRCKDVRIAGLNLINSPSYTIHPYGCERLVIDGLYIRSSLSEGVWADGIDPDGCKDVRIANCTIETGDDAIVFYSMNWFGPPLPCENITVSNCRLTSSSSAIKFCDGNMNAIRNVTIDNCAITGSNRGIAFMDFDGGTVSDVVLSNLTIECTRRDWFWWGDGDPLHFNVKRRSEIHKNIQPGSEPPAGKIRRVLISNVIARGMGSSLCNGHPDNWLEDITIDNFKLYLSSDPKAPYDKAVHALKFQQVKNLKLSNVEIHWDKPASAKWESALVLEDIQGLILDGFSGRQAQLGMTAPVIVLNNVENAVVRNSSAQAGSQRFLEIRGKNSKDIVLFGNDVREAKEFCSVDKELAKGAVRELSNISAFER